MRVHFKTSAGCFAAIAGLVLCTVSGAEPLNAGGLPPWNFEMTPQEVTAFTEYGPYKSFSNGDLETYAGVFNGHKENVQFFFKDGRLARIGIYLYEGISVKDASEAWGRAYAALKLTFGDINLPDIHVPSGSPELAPEVVAVAAGANVDAVGKSQMAPAKQPSDKFVFASFRRANVQGHAFYYVIVYYEPPHG